MNRQADTQIDREKGDCEQTGRHTDRQRFTNRHSKRDSFDKDTLTRQADIHTDREKPTETVKET